MAPIRAAMPKRSVHLTHIAGATVAIIMFAACGGGSGTPDSESGQPPEPSAGDAGDADASNATADVAGSEPGGDTGSDGEAESEAPSGVSFVEIDGQLFEFTNVTTCTYGDAFWGPDFRRFGLDNGNAFPGISVGYAPQRADNEGVEDPNVVAVFPSEDPWWYSTDAATVSDYEIALTDDGATGSATVGVMGSGGPQGEWLARFELSCGDAAPRSDENGSSGEEPEGSGGTPEASDIDTGTISVDGDTSSLVGPTRSDMIITGEDSSGEFDFEICETINPAFAGDFNVAGTLTDGTQFRLTGNVDETPGEFDGLFLGDAANEERASNLDVALTDRTLWGTATTSRGVIEFTFTC